MPNRLPVDSRLLFRGSTPRAWRFLAGLLAVVLVPGIMQMAGQGGHTSVAAPTISPHDWAKETALHEVALLHHGAPFLRYRMHVIDEKGDQVRDVLESKDGTVARLILRQGRPLTSDEDTAEKQRLQDMLDSPAAFGKHIRNEESGKKLAGDLVLQMPDAMTWTYTLGQPASGRAGPGAEVVMDFYPNPAWNPPTVTAGALTGLEGRLWIDSRSHEMVKMEGHVFKPVNLGFGMLAHIYPGGQLSLEQTDAAAQRWIYTHFVQHVSVRALLLKTLKVDAEVTSTNYQVVPAMSYQDAIRLLLNTPLPSR